jgi:hypothetical protein
VKVALYDKQVNLHVGDYHKTNLCKVNEDIQI